MTAERTADNIRVTHGGRGLLYLRIVIVAVVVVVVATAADKLYRTLGVKIIIIVIPDLNASSVQRLHRV